MMIQRNLKRLLLLLFSLQTINIYAYLRFHEGRLLKVGKCRWGESLRLEEDSRSLEETRAWWSSSQISSLRTNQSWAKELVGAFALGTLAMNRGNVSEENIRYTGQFYHQLLDPSIQDFELSLADVGSTMIFTYAWMLSQQLHHHNSLSPSESSLKHDSSLKRFLHYLEENIFNTSIAKNSESQFYQEIEEYLEESKSRRFLSMPSFPQNNKNEVEKAKTADTMTVTTKTDPVAVLNSIINGNFANVNDSERKFNEESLESKKVVKEIVTEYPKEEPDITLEQPRDYNRLSKIDGILQDEQDFKALEEDNVEENSELLDNTTSPSLSLPSQHERDLSLDDMYDSDINFENKSEDVDEFDGLLREDEEERKSNPQLCFESINMSEYSWLHAPFKNQPIENQENSHSTRLDELQQIIKREYQAFPSLKTSQVEEEDEDEDEISTDDDQTSSIPSISPPERKRMRMSETKEVSNHATAPNNIPEDQENNLPASSPDPQRKQQSENPIERSSSSSPKSAYSTAIPSISGMKFKPPPKRKSIKDALFGSSTTEYLHISQQLGFQRTHRHSGPYSATSASSSLPPSFPDTSHPHYQRYTSKQEQIEQLLERSLPHSYDHSQHQPRHPAKLEPSSLTKLLPVSDIPSQVSSLNTETFSEKPFETIDIEDKVTASSIDKTEDTTPAKGWEDENDDEIEVPENNGNSDDNDNDESDDDSDWSYFHNYPASVQVDINQVKIRSQISWNQLRNSGSSIYELAQKRFKKENQQSITKHIQMNEQNEVDEVPVSKPEIVKRVEKVSSKQTPLPAIPPKPVSPSYSKSKKSIKDLSASIKELPSIPTGTSSAAASIPSSIRETVNVSSPASYLPLVSASIKDLIETVNSTTPPNNGKEEGVITIKNMMEKDKKKQVNDLIASSKERFSKFNFFPSKIKVDDVPLANITSTEAGELNLSQSPGESSNAGGSSDVSNGKSDTVYSSGLNDTMSDFGMRTFIMETPAQTLKEMKAEEEKVAAQRSLLSAAGSLNRNKDMDNRNKKRKLVRVNDRYVYMNEDNN